MSLHPRPIFNVPEETARIAHAAFPKGNLYLRMRDRLGVFFTDEQFASLFSERGQPAFCPWRLALISIMQFVEDLPDRQAADAVRGRIDWKYALGLKLEDSGFDYSLLSEFRQRLVSGGLEQNLLDKMLAVLAEQKMLKRRGRQRTDSTHVLAAIRRLNRLETIGETMRAALNAIAAVAPDWLRQIAPLDWYDRYQSRVEEWGLPRDKKERETWGVQVGQDGLNLLEQIYQSKTHSWLREAEAVQTLRRTWVHQFYYQDERLCLRQSEDLPPSSIRSDSPYDPEAHYSVKRQTNWVGYKVHLTESCDDDQPHIITHVETTIASQPDANMSAPIHEALAAKGYVPETHLVDAGYVDIDQVATSEQDLNIRLFGPVRSNVSWQAKAQAGYARQEFQINWEAQTVVCPRGIVSDKWRPGVDSQNNEVIKVIFPKQECGACPTRQLCTRSVEQPRQLTLRSQTIEEKLQASRQKQSTEEWKEEYRRRAGIEGTISQGVNGFGLRECRYIGLAKTHLQHILTAAAINLARLDNWFTGKGRAQTRTSRFATLRPALA